MNHKFDELTLKQELLKNLVELKFSSMTPIQAKALPVVLSGQDVLAQAKTGSGKTAAFGLGILNSLDTSSARIQSLILCPTRELAEQVAKEIRTLARMQKNVKVLTICGGTSEHHQERSLAHSAHIIVGTPGRVIRLLKKKILHTSFVNTLVLDEADRMLDMGFFDDIMDIASYVPEQRQTLLFSATYPEEIWQMSEQIQHEAIEIKVDVEHEQNNINQIFVEVKNHKEKDEALLRVLGKYQPERLIVFCRTRQTTDAVAKLLNQEGVFAAAIHGDLEQSERTAVLTMFSNRSLSVLVATDVAARGLDIQDLPAVINYDLPNDLEVYVHRIGRTGRAGKTGLAFSLYLQKNGYVLDDIEELTNTKVEVADFDDLSPDTNYERIPPMKTMFIGGGKKNKLRPGDILGALVGEAKLDSSDVGDISIFPILSYVAIKNDVIDDAIIKLENGKIKNRKFRVGHA